MYESDPKEEKVKKTFLKQLYTNGLPYKSEKNLMKTLILGEKYLNDEKSLDAVLLSSFVL